jgi:hypothetical protein
MYTFTIYCPSLNKITKKVSDVGGLHDQLLSTSAATSVILPKQIIRVGAGVAQSV